jgi:hypothetical protein
MKVDRSALITDNLAELKKLGRRPSIAYPMEGSVCLALLVRDGVFGKHLWISIAPPSNLLISLGSWFV